MLQNKNTIIFDFDGTLVDTMHIFADVASHLMSVNYDIDKEEARAQYFKTSGLPFSYQLEEIFPNHKLNSQTASLYEIQKLDATDDIILNPETLEVLEKLKDYGYNLIVSSNNYQHNIDNFIIKNEINSLFNLALGYKDGFGKGENHFNHILHELGVDKKDTIFIGDSLNDAKLAEASGIDFIGMVGTFNKKDFIAQNKFIKVIYNIKELIN